MHEDLTATASYFLITDDAMVTTVAPNAPG
jgi:hypothetical protein